MAFLVAIMSARQVGQIGALTAYPLYTLFQKDKVMLYPHTKFLLKVPSSFHISQPIHLSLLLSEASWQPTGGSTARQTCVSFLPGQN